VSGEPPVQEDTAQGKLGLALSGGGHRAAFFHIGVLARLAELGRLRKIEVISTVSGGSIVGAAYYLYVKKLLESTKNAEVKDEHYVKIVEDLQAHYRQAMAKNLRGIALDKYFKNYKLVLPSFSRTDRIAELLEEHFYRPIIGGSGPIDLYSLRIEPLDDTGASIKSFDPRADAGRVRNAPVPILFLNATTLNTGHNWRFEATWLGEPELKSLEDADVDKNVHLVQWKREALPEDQRRTLGIAVASSGCFPGGLAPVSINKLFAGKTAEGEDDPYAIKLVDGGVRDNQGIDALLDNDCKRIIISDGSAQMNEAAEPGTRLPALLPRVMSIEGKESREQRILRAYGRCGGESVAFMHLLTGVPATTLEPLGATPMPGWPPPPAPSEVGPTGLDEEAQRLLAQTRTDLDAFSDLEASSLMEAGYRIAKAVLGQVHSYVLDGATAVAGPSDWRFRVVGPLLAQPTTDYKVHLRVARMRFFKPLAYRLAPIAAWVREHVPRKVRNLLGIIVGLAAAGALAFAGVALGDSSISAAAVYAVAVGLLVILVLYLGSQVPGLRMISHLFFDMALTLVGALLPFFVFGKLQVASGKKHRDQGPDGAPAG
jgi:predicted acylesterase/phospholipase RssA